MQLVGVAPLSFTWLSFLPTKEKKMLYTFGRCIYFDDGQSLTAPTQRSKEIKFFSFLSFPDFKNKKASLLDAGQKRDDRRNMRAERYPVYAKNCSPPLNAAQITVL